MRINYESDFIGNSEFECLNKNEFEQFCISCISKNSVIVILPGEGDELNEIIITKTVEETVRSFDMIKKFDKIFLQEFEYGYEEAILYISDFLETKKEGDVQN